MILEVRGASDDHYAHMIPQGIERGAFPEAFLIMLL